MTTIELPVDILRYCSVCKGVQGHYLLKLAGEQQCLKCKTITPRFDLRPRVWAGV